LGETLTRPCGGALATKKILCRSMKAACSGSILTNCLPMPVRPLLSDDVETKS
jgi:hypothetical protein